MLILSIDSAGMGCGVCIWHDGMVLAEASERMERGQDRRLMPLVLEIMKGAGVIFDDLDRIAVTRGPGSFTGLRIGLAAARGIGLASSKPVIGIDRFKIFHAQLAEPGSNLLVVIDSRRRELFTRFFPQYGPADEADMMTPEEIHTFLEENPNTTVTGDMIPPGVSNFRPPSVKETVVAAALAASADPNDPEFMPRPLYLRAPDVTMKKPPLLIRPVIAEHASALTELHIAGFGPTAWTLKQMEGSLALDTTRGWVAIRGDTALGFILSQMTPGRAEILTFAVHPEAQRQGIGERLVRTVLDAARDSGNGHVFLEVAADNLAARHLYEKLEFRAAGIRKNYYRRGDEAVDAVFYEKLLSPALGRRQGH